MSEDQPLSQEDIDAALGGDTEADPPAGASDAAASETDPSESINQDDIDALLNDAAPAEESAPEATPSETVGQDDIDALLNDAQGLADEVAAESAEPPADTASAPSPPSEEVRLDSAGRPFDAAAAEMAAAIASEQTSAPAPTAPAPPPPGAEAMHLPDLGSGEEQSDAWEAIDLLKDVDLHVKIELGRSRMLVEDVLRLGEGSVVELDKLAGDPVDVYVNDRLVARGEVLVLNDNFCVRINEIISDLSKEFQTA